MAFRLFPIMFHPGFQDSSKLLLKEALSSCSLLFGKGACLIHVNWKSTNETSEEITTLSKQKVS